MILLLQLLSASLFVCPAAAEYLSGLTRVGSAKAVTADILDGVTKGAGKEYAVLYNVAYNDKKSYIDVPLGEVRFNVTVYSANTNLVLDTVNRVAKARGFIYQVVCGETKDSPQNLVGVRCKVTMQPSTLTDLSFKTMRACNDAVAANTNSSKHSCSCSAKDGRAEELDCAFDYEPIHSRDAPLSTDIVNRLRAATRDLVKCAGYALPRLKMKCYHNEQYKAVGHLAAGQIHCDLKMKPLPPQPLCTFLGYLFSRC
ncbi:hypothetical protein PRIPAC_85462 [Pristionchus pacificus]|uniref:Uncharacterized protein n=1 Tax=Pristionchus pacificus TaxID=54126 RepID=A0A2A6BLZ4_PRIPA|nr:hypothetical protein PRIPAC_85462 [Pristionchus pacificus]|eukprot:PDM66878.1 hypothetical protein PRIPAC_48295 [Pristionchus pacificus]